MKKEVAQLEVSQWDPGKSELEGQPVTHCGKEGESCGMSHHASVSSTRKYAGTFYTPLKNSLVRKLQVEKVF